MAFVRILISFIMLCISACMTSDVGDQEVVQSYISPTTGRVLQRRVQNSIIVSEQKIESSVALFLSNIGFHLDDNDEWVLATQRKVSQNGQEPLQVFPGNDYLISFQIIAALFSSGNYSFGVDWARKQCELVRSASIDEISQVADRLISLLWQQQAGLRDEETSEQK